MEILVRLRQLNCNLPMSRHIGLIGLFLFIFQILSYGQVSLVWQGGSDYLSVDSYGGAVSQTDIAKLKISGSGNITLANWKLTARIVNYPVSNTNGGVFPAEKVSFSPTGTSGNLKPGPAPSVSQIGMPLSVAFQNGPSEVYLVPNSNAPLIQKSPNSNEYFEFTMGFNLKVASGSYLNTLQGWKQYPFLIEYTLYDQTGTPISRLQHTFRIQVGSLGPPPAEENRYSIRVSAEASNGLLEFSTMSDYIHGKSVTYTDGLQVSATTGYQVTVKAVSTHFISLSGATLPLDVVRLQLSGGGSNMHTRSLSTASQSILEGTSTGGITKVFDITYSTQVNDNRLFHVSPEQYETSLMYEISPR